MTTLSKLMLGGALDELVVSSLSCSARTMTKARDYFYQDRVKAILIDGKRHRLAGRVRGYQDYYVASVVQSADGLAIACSCERPSLCAHAVAVIYAKEQQPWLALDISRLEPVAQAWWRWMSGEAFPWPALTYPDPAFLQPWSAHLDPPKSVPWSTSFFSTGYHQMIGQLGLVHATWWENADFVRDFNQLWERDEFLAKAMSHLDDWIGLSSRAPEIPLGRLWQKAAGHLMDYAPRLQALLWQDDIDARRVENLLRLLEMAWAGTHANWLESLRQQFAWADPHGIETALFYRRAGLLNQAAATLEAHLPQDKTRRAPYRALLIELTSGDEKVGHQVADFLENPSESKRQQLWHDLSPEARLQWLDGVTLPKD